ncbi:ribonuclease H2, subunit B [Gloeopeniophorella convolvens]|nr:ribonuclease H2, subunit B [Gloeopeniophorella convolvens]
MTAHIGVLPLDLLDAVTRKINEQEGADAASTFFLRLPHPRTAIPSLFLPYRRSQSAGGTDAWDILEVQSTSPPNPRSWFFTEGEVISDGKLLVMTPVDPVFLLIPILQAVRPESGSSGVFQPLDDILDEAVPKITQAVNAGLAPGDSSTSLSQEDILSLAKYDCIVSAMKSITDFQQITPELTVYRYSEDKAIQYLQAKVSRLSRQEVAEKSRTIVRGLAKDGLMDDGKEDLLKLGYVKSACNLVSQYTPHSLYLALLAKYDFTALDAHVKTVRDEQIAVAAMGVPVVKQKVTDTVEDGSKKRKAKSKGSQGVEKLKKVNVSGMSKISSFFQKK